MKKKYRRLNAFTISLLIICAGVFAYIWKIPFMDFMELKTIDLRFRNRGEIPAASETSSDPTVVLAVIDEKSITREGKWVWPRSKLAKLVYKISQAGAKVIAFDIGFLESDRNSNDILRTIDEINEELLRLEIRNDALEERLDIMKARADNDRLLTEAVRNSRAKVILGYFFHMKPETPAHMDKTELDAHEENIRSSQYKIVLWPRGMMSDSDLFFEAAAPQSNIEIISQTTKYSGFFNMFPDDDGSVRRIPGVIRFRDNFYVPLSLMAVSAYKEQSLSVKMAEFGIESLGIGDISIPTDEYGIIMVNYRGGEKKFPHISVSDILNGDVPVKSLKDKIVIVGVTAVGIYDMRVTPFSTVFPGVEIHANIIDSILSQDFLAQPVWFRAFDIMAIVLGCILLGILLPRTGAFAGVLSLSVIFGAYMLLCREIFLRKGLILNMVYPLSVMLLLYACLTAYKYFLESGQKKFIKNAFSTYLAPSVVEALIKSPEKLVLGGEERVITAFFSDVQGFTGISEKLSPSQLVELLNEFLTEMTDIILRYEGTVDKFEGDAIIAFFGAPGNLANHAKAACMACMDMQKRLDELRNIWRSQGKPELRMRIGLFSGFAVVGNMGSRSRMDYTMMGDTVNTAARLEGVNKIYGTYTMAGEDTWRQAEDEIMAREIDSISVVGKQEPVRVYELMAYADEVDDRLRHAADTYAHGLAAYRYQQWDRAILFFSTVLELIPDDGPSRTMLARCENFMKNPPDKGWNGAFVMNTK